MEILQTRRQARKTYRLSQTRARGGSLLPKRVFLHRGGVSPRADALQPIVALEELRPTHQNLSPPSRPCARSFPVRCNPPGQTENTPCTTSAKLGTDSNNAPLILKASNVLPNPPRLPQKLIFPSSEPMSHYDNLTVWPSIVEYE